MTHEAFPTDGPTDRLSIPVIAEKVVLDTRLVDTGRGVMVRKSVVETPHEIAQPLRQDHLRIEHVAQDRLLDPADLPASRYEGDTLIIPVIEEVLVVHKELRLKEEIRITRSSNTAMSRHSVVLKSEHVHVERFDENVDPRSKQDDPGTGVGA